MTTPALVRVLVIEDSAYMRKAIREMLEKSPHIQVVGTSHDGQLGIEMAAELRPNVVTVDLYMPNLNGVDFIRQQMKIAPLPIVVCSSSNEGGDLFLAAMEAGAVEYVQKPTALALDSMYNIQQKLIEAVLAAASVPVEKLEVPNEAVPVPQVPAQWVEPQQRERKSEIEAVLIGVSTGGPRALRSLLPKLPRDLPVPVCIVLHMPPGYTNPLAQKLNEISPLEVVESSEGTEMRAGRAILAQAGLHTRLVRREDGVVVTKLSVEPRTMYVPSVDELFESGAAVYDGRLLGVVMTGMGNDGTAGAAWIKAKGGVVFAEAEKSSVIYGMPRSVVEAGLADRVVDLNQLAQAIMEEIL
jgi:two-component system, chemotaxis family, protein-glutamate methylesterase/glutaminase